MRKNHAWMRPSIRACALSLSCAALLAVPAALAQTAEPSAAVAAAKGRVDQETARLNAAIEAEAARLSQYMDQADVAADKSMDRVGVQARERLLQGVTRLIREGERAIPRRVDPAWASGAANECQQLNGAAGASNGSARCASTNDSGSRAETRAQGDGASAAANAANTGRALARAQGDRSSATARSGDAARPGQRDNVSDAVATGGSSSQAVAGSSHFDENNNVTAVAAEGSRASAEATAGDNNRILAGAFNRGEANATNRAGDRNTSIALGANGSRGPDAPAGANPLAMQMSGARSMTLFGFDNHAMSVVDGPNSVATTNAGYGDRHWSAATASANSHARADAAQGEDNAAFADARNRGHALSYTSYGDNLVAISRSTGDDSTGSCSPIGRPQNSGETNYPPDVCATANARSVDGNSNIAIAIVDRAKGYAVAERGVRNTAVVRATNGGNIVWNTAEAGPNQTPNPHQGQRADCPWPLPPLPQAQQACGNGTAKASYGDGNLAVALPNGDHSFAWSEASGGSYNQTLATAGANARARARATYNSYGTAKAVADNGGNADASAGAGQHNVALANANGAGAVANVTAYGPYARATGAASVGGIVTAIHNTTSLPGGFGASMSTTVQCSNNAVTYAMLGDGQTCGTGF